MMQNIKAKNMANQSHITTRAVLIAFSWLFSFWVDIALFRPALSRSRAVSMTPIFYGYGLSHESMPL
jgi:hypothetical protein